MADFKVLPKVNGINVSLVGHIHPQSEVIPHLAFRAVPSITQSIANQTFTKVKFGTKVYDNKNAFDTTLSRFISPILHTVYRVSATINLSSGTVGQLLIYKNGVSFQTLFDTSNNQAMLAGATELPLVPGDYLEIWTYISQTRTVQIASTVFTVSSIY